MKHSESETKEEKIFNLVVELYPKYYSRLTGNKRYKFILSESRIKQICRFSVHVLSKVVVPGEDLMKNYLEYAFGKYAGRKNHLGKENAFPITWIISKKLFDEYLNSTSGKRWFVSKLFSKEQVRVTDSNKKKVIKTKSQINKERVQKNKMIKNISDFEEKEKQRFYGSEKGLYWCVDFTTLYNPKSELCLNCKNEKQCLAILKENFPKLYEIRVKNG